MKVYQVKMKNYKRVPIPVTLYRLMQVYLKNTLPKRSIHFSESERWSIFQKHLHGADEKYCSQIGIQNGEYILSLMITDIP